MGVFESTRNLTSFRECRDETIPRKVMGKILESGRQAPSPGNVHAVEFIVVEGEHERQKLEQITGDERARTAPTSVIIIADVDRMARRVGKRKAEDFCNSESATAVQNMRLAAAEEGLSSCWITGFDHQVVGDQFGIPSGKKAVGVVMFGYSDQPVQTSSKFGLNEICFYDEYDNQVTSAFDSLEWHGLKEAKSVYGKKGRGLLDKIRRKVTEHL